MNLYGWVSVVLILESIVTMMLGWPTWSSVIPAATAVVGLCWVYWPYLTGERKL